MPSGALNLHQLRHSALTHAAEDGDSTAALLSYSRHTSEASFARYARVSAEALSRWWRHRTIRTGAHPGSGQRAGPQLVMTTDAAPTSKTAPGTPNPGQPGDQSYIQQPPAYPPQRQSLYPSQAPRRTSHPGYPAPGYQEAYPPQGEAYLPPMMQPGGHQFAPSASGPGQTLLPGFTQQQRRGAQQVRSGRAPRHWWPIFKSQADCMTHYGVALQDAGNTGKALGAGLIVLTWVVADFFLGVGYGVYKLATR
jgi:hypothetical protein